MTVYQALLVFIFGSSDPVQVIRAELVLKSFILGR